MKKVVGGLLLSLAVTLLGVRVYAQAPVAVGGGAPGGVSTSGGGGGAGVAGGGTGTGGTAPSTKNGAAALIQNSGQVEDEQAPQRSVQTTYDTSPQAGGSGGSDDGGQQQPMSVKSSSGISPNMPQVGGPAQLNFHQRHSHAEVTQTKVIFAGGQAVKVDEPVVMEYTWTKPQEQVGYARVIPRKQPSRKTR